MRFSFGNDNNLDKALKQAEKYAQQGKYSAAVDEYGKILEAYPSDVTLLNTVGDLCVRAGRNDDAIRHLLRAAETYEAEKAIPPAVAVYKKLLKIDPANVDRAVKLADLYTRQGLIAEARRAYQNAVEAYRSGGERQKAFRLMQKIADLDPENVALRLELGDQYLQSGLEKDAYQAYLQAGQELQRRGRVDESLEAFGRALEVRPDSKIALNALADGYAQQGKVIEALRMLDVLLAKSPDDADLLNILGRTYVNANLLDEAETTFSRLARIDPARTDALLEVARHHVEGGNYDRAIAILDGCVDTLLARGLKKRATALLKEIIKRDRSHVEALRRLADIYSRVDERRNLSATLNTLVEAASRKGLKDVATDALQRLVEIEPDVAARQAVAVSVEQALPAAGSNPKDFPEGFESGPALMEWSRGPAAESPAPRAPARSARPEGYEASPGMIEITRGLGDEPVFEIGGEADRNEYDVPDHGFAAVDADAAAYSEYSMELADELVAQHPEFIQAKIKLLEELVASQPKYVAGRTKLKKLYVDAGMADKAAAQCVELAKLYEEEGERDKAKECLSEAYELKPSVQSLTSQASAPVLTEETVALDEIFTLQEFNKYFDREWRRAIRDAKPLSLVRLAVDAFNDYLDTYGLLSGDYCLERIAGVLEGDLLRPGDLLSSLGGGVFLVLLPDTPGSAVGIVAERLRGKVENLGIRHESSTIGGCVTVSVGGATAIPHPKYASDTLLRATEDALVQARFGGGNRVAVAPLITN